MPVDKSAQCVIYFSFFHIRFCIAVNHSGKHWRMDPVRVCFENWISSFDRMIYARWTRFIGAGNSFNFLLRAHSPHTSIYSLLSCAKRHTNGHVNHVVGAFNLSSISVVESSPTTLFIHPFNAKKKRSWKKQNPSHTWNGFDFTRQEKRNKTPYARCGPIHDTHNWTQYIYICEWEQKTSRHTTSG